MKLNNFKFVTNLLIQLCFGFGADVHAKTAVRHPDTSETEFQALAQALGHTPVSDMLTEKSSVKFEIRDLYNSRLVEAQAAWLNRKTDHPSIEAIDRFIALASIADWSPKEREAFKIFIIRKIQINETSVNQDDQLFEELDAFIAVDEYTDFSEMPKLIKTKWNAYKARQKNEVRVISKNLPDDVTVVVVNGRKLSQLSATSFQFPNRPVRVTLISNAYLPVSFILSSTSQEWPDVQRQPWVNSGCSITPLPAVYGADELNILGMSECNDSGNDRDESQLTAKRRRSDRELIENFGLVKASTTPFNQPSQNGAQILKRPWFWGIVGALTVGAIVAIQARENQSSATVVPSIHESW